MPVKDLQFEIRRHYTAWIARNQYVMPNLTDALDFMATEVAEAIEKRLRRTSYVRNNPEEYPDNRAIAIEIFDAIMMGCIALDILGEDLNEVAAEKLKRMDDKRK